MKRRIALLMAAMMLATIPGSVVMASDVADAVIVEDEAESALLKSEEAESEFSDEEINEVLVEAVEEVSEDEPATVQEAEDEPAAIAGSGACGDNLTWSISTNGTLTISGSGVMYDYAIDYLPVEGSEYLTDSYYDEEGHYHELYSYSEYEEVWSAPWADTASSITSVIFGNGVTGIGAYAFYECENIKSISISDTVVTIGTQAFYHCTGLTNPHARTPGTTINETVQPVGY